MRTENPTDEQNRMERLERMLLHPEGVTPEEWDEWRKDKELRALYRTAVDARRSLLEEQPLPDAKEEYRAFKHRHRSTEEAPQPTVPGKQRRRWYLAAAAAACLLFLFAFWLGTRRYAPPESIQVYYARQGSDNIRLTIGRDTVNLTGSQADSLLLANGVLRGDEQLLDYTSGKDSVDSTPHSLSIPQGKNAQLTLPDGTRVWLNAESRLTYPRTFRGGNRWVELEGEAYFEVAKDPEHPFIVQSGSWETIALGTAFNVCCPESGHSHVTLVEGMVRVRYQGEQATLHPGEQASVNAAGRLALSQVDIKSYTCWKEGYFYFDDETLHNIVVELGRWYNMDVIFLTTEHWDDLLHFHAEKEWGIEEAARHITLISDAHVHVEEGQLIIE